MRGDGVLLSATDIEIYKICPLRYKYARVFSIPRESTLQQRFGILVHQVLERFHTQLANEQAINGDRDLERAGSQGLRALYEAGWRRQGFGESNEERQLYEKGLEALARYHDDFAASDSTPVWFERSFSFRLGSHMLRGRVDRVDRHPDGSFELIDYKTGKAKKPSQLKDDVQLSLYQIGAKRVLEARRLQAELLLRAGRRAGAAGGERGDVEQVQETRSRSPRASAPSSSSRGRRSGLQHLRLPAHLPRRREVTRTLGAPVIRLANDGLCLSE